jgi:hypothetical protein
VSPDRLPHSRSSHSARVLYKSRVPCQALSQGVLPVVTRKAPAQGLYIPSFSSPRVTLSLVGWWQVGQAVCVEWGRSEESGRAAATCLRDGHGGGLAHVPGDLALPGEITESSRRTSRSLRSGTALTIPRGIRTRSSLDQSRPSPLKRAHLMRRHRASAHQGPIRPRPRPVTRFRRTPRTPACRGT